MRELPSRAGCRAYGEHFRRLRQVPLATRRVASLELRSPQGLAFRNGVLPPMRQHPSPSGSLRRYCRGADGDLG